MKKLVEKNGGKFDGVALRVTLSWSGCNDLDIHLVEPRGEEIWWDNTQSRAGGFLDVDANADLC